MTCTVAMIENGVTYIGADSLGSNSVLQTVRDDHKVFKLSSNPDFLLGFAGSYRVGQVAQHSLYIDLEKKTLKNKINSYTSNIGFELFKPDLYKVTHGFMVNRFVKELQRSLTLAGAAQLFNGTEKYVGGSILVGYKDKIFRIEQDYQVGIPIHNYTAIGSGEAVAKGVLYAIHNTTNFTPEEKIIIALQAAAEFAVGVKGPFYVMNTKNDEVHISDD
jgi:ATP-dependent protease HslVU (ClpYQ) peptidase subunit